MSVFGSGEADTHALSVAFALLTVPAAWLGARALFGDRAAWIAALLATINPFLTYYAQETRMYTLVALLSTVVTATFVVVFVQRRRALAARLLGRARAARLRPQLGPVPRPWGRWRRSSRCGAPAPTGARCCATRSWPTG